MLQCAVKNEKEKERFNSKNFTNGNDPVLRQHSRRERTWVVESYRVEFEPLPLDKLNGIGQFACKFWALVVSSM